MISALSWVPKGSANPFPTKFDIQSEEIEEFDQEEIEELPEEEEDQKENNNEDTSDEEEDEEEQIKKLENEEKEEIQEDKQKSFMERYNFDDYDDDEDKDEDEEEKGLKFINKAMKGLMFYKDADTDPFLKEQDEEIDDIEDIVIRPTDSILVTAIAQSDDDFSHLDVMIYEEDCDNLYVHHDIILSSFPLTLAWMDQHPSNRQEKGNFIAVGTFDPFIEIWDLDLIDNPVPTVTLGQEGKEKGIKGKKVKKTSTCHKDSVMSLAWNSQQRNILASGSGDKTIKIWDLTTQDCLNTFSVHKDKVQTLQWNSQEKTVLISGSYDKTVNILDMRTAGQSSFKWNIKSDIEVVQWNPHNAKEFTVASDDGYIRCFDATLGSNSKPLWSVKAHNSSVQAFSYSPGPVGYFATGSSDQTVKLWKLDESGKPGLIQEKNLGEQVFSLSFFSNSPYLLAIGSENNRPYIVNTKRFVSVQNSFSVEKVEGFESEPSLKGRKQKVEEDESDDEDEEVEEEEDEEEDEEEMEDVDENQSDESMDE
ncbi:WD40 repeat-containing protein [Tieghemostelium lacteum]|uniref:WD40 repeat-containing protein n=1 Tax=Tieghemostelium lacteum TaxID=361077 RepID=A0A151Z8G4_TIELA|nr:WD40 repeat-containing protein [Tieghemostelium lacteum]|eukprot:KYQ90256.1 WD40 repeat-containing protein [Tieghemostelium lacteum]